MNKEFENINKIANSALNNRLLEIKDCALGLELNKKSSIVYFTKHIQCDFYTLRIPYSDDLFRIFVNNARFLKFFQHCEEIGILICQKDKYIIGNVKDKHVKLINRYLNSFENYS